MSSILNVAAVLDLPRALKLRIENKFLWKVQKVILVELIEEIRTKKVT